MAQGGIKDTTLVTDANLVSYYKGYDTSDSKGSNTLTNNNSVAFNPGTVYQDSATIGNAFDGGTANPNKWLNGNYDYGVSTGNFSISFWFKTYDDTIGEQDLIWIAKNAASTQLFRCWIEDVAGTKKFTFYRGGSGDDRADYTAAPGTTWHFFVGTYDGTNIKLYIDNTLRATTASSGSRTPPTTQLAVLSDHLGASFTSGLMQDIGIWSRALTSVEVNTLYTALAPVVNISGDTGNMAFFM